MAVLLCFLPICILLCYVVCSSGSSEGEISNDELLLLREETREAFLHSYDSYMTHAYPFDELMPLSCRPRRHDERTRGTLDDVLGGYMLTLVDSLDSLVIMREYGRFAEALRLIEEGLSFDRDISISVFEANIRVLGGLLSAHQLAAALFDHTIYDGKFLLDKAGDLGDRLLPAFATRTGIPIHKVNLRHGVSDKDIKHNCPAAGASFLVEMGLLSRLSGNPQYETAARKALKAIWERRSDLDLIGAMIDTKSGSWISTHSGIGAGIDSYFETLLKSHILLGDMDLLEWFDAAYDAVQRHTVKKGIHVEVHMSTGRQGPVYSNYVSALQAFWPGLQTLAGHVMEGEESFYALNKLWKKYSMLPDMYDTATNRFLSHSHGYPLRPELIESAYHLYTATGKGKYVRFGRDAFHSLQNKTKTECGYASVADVRTGRLDDRMDSYFLAETLMYFFLLFDEALPSNLRSSVFCHGSPVESQGGSDALLFTPNETEVCPPIESETVDLKDGEGESAAAKLTVGVEALSTEGEVLIAEPIGVVYTEASSKKQNQTAATTCRTRSQTDAQIRVNINKKEAVQSNYQQCIQKVSTIFSTEGHLFVIDPMLRPLLARSRGTSSAVDHADRHVCDSQHSN